MLRGRSKWAVHGAWTSARRQAQTQSLWVKRAATDPFLRRLRSVLVRVSAVPL